MRLSYLLVSFWAPDPVFVMISAVALAPPAAFSSSALTQLKCTTVLGEAEFLISKIFHH